MNHTSRWLFWAVMLVGVGLRLQSITMPLIDHHCYRQSTEAMMARNFDRYGITLQYPLIEGYSSDRVDFVNEFPLYPALVATVYRLLGPNDVIGRLITLLFSCATGWLVFRLLARYYHNSTPYWGMALFLLSPLGWFLGRTFLRHPMAFFFQLACFFYWLKWLEEKRWGDLFLTGVCGAVTILMNFANAYIGLPMLVALLLLHGPRGLLDRKHLALAVAMLLPSWLWLQHAIKFGAWFLVGDQARDGGRLLRLEWVNMAFVESLWDGYWKLLLTPVGFLLVLVGLVVAVRRIPAGCCAVVWFLTVLLYFCVDHYPIYINRHEYYFLHALLPASMLGGIAAGRVVDWLSELLKKRFPAMARPCWKNGDEILQQTTRAQLLAAVVLAVVFLVGGWAHYHTKLRNRYLVEEPGWIQHWVQAGKAVQELLPEDAVMVVDQSEDALIYHCNRRGFVTDWRTLTPDLLENMRSQGARYLLITSYQWEDGPAGYLFDDPLQGSPAAPHVRKLYPVLYEGNLFQIVHLEVPTETDSDV